MIKSGWEDGIWGMEQGSGECLEGPSLCAACNRYLDEAWYQ
jgi:hypothetical protein